MIQKIQGEQPFQILSDAFSIGPSNTGYELQISADGSHFSTLFTVGANTTRLVSNVANGSFYRLKNNVGEVAVNWRTTCKGGGSGGSGSGSTVVVNQVLSAGTEIAQISVDGVPTSLYAPEGGEGGGNVIGVDYSELVSGATFPVNEIISAATEGDLVYMTYKPNGVRSITYMYLKKITTTGTQKAFNFTGNGDDGYTYSTIAIYNTELGILTLGEVTRTKMAKGMNYYSIAAIEDADYPERKALFVEWVSKVNSGETIAVSGLCQTNYRTAILPLTRIYSGTSYSAESGYQGGWAEFAAIVGNNNYQWYVMSSAGNISGSLWSSGSNSNKMFIASGNTFYTLPKASASTLGGVKIGSGITVDSNGVISAQGGGSKLIYLNLLTEQERIALYNEIMAYEDANMPICLSSGFPASDYSFYCIFTNNWRPFTDECDGVIKMEVTQIHPTDYGGAVIFTGTAYSRLGYERLCTLRYAITFDGQTDIDSKIVQITPGVNGFSFGWGEYAPLKYDVANQQFLQGENETVINPSGATYGIAGSDDINQLLNDGGVSYFTDRQRYGASKYEIVIKDNGTEHKYQNPSIIREEITTKTVDGENFSNKYTFVYTREDGGRFLVKMALGDDNNQYGTDFEYVNIV